MFAFDLASRKMVQSYDGRYNIETIYKIYCEGILSLSKSPKGGSFNLRDAVLTEQFEEIVEFKLHDKSWLKMFQAFLREEVRTLPVNVIAHNMSK